MPNASHSRRRFNRWIGASLAAVAAALALSGTAWAQDFPTKPITLIVPFNPGGQADSLTRLVAEQMTTTLGQPVVVENRGGAGGAVGTTAVAQAEPDGHFIGYSSSGTTVVLPLTSDSLTYDVEGDLTPIGQMFEVGMMVVARKDFEHDTIEEIVTAGMAEPAGITVGNTGTGALAHLVAIYLSETLGIEVTHVPYQGDGPQITALLNGELDLGIVSVQAAGEYVEGDQVLPVAILGGEQVPSMPGVPTVAESGYDGFSAGTFGGLHAPIGTPPEVVEKLHAAMAAALEVPSVEERVLAFASSPVGSTPEEYGARIESEREQWGELIERLDITAE